MNLEQLGEKRECLLCPSQVSQSVSPGISKLLQIQATPTPIVSQILRFDWTWGFSIDWPFTFLLALIFFFFFFYKSIKLGMTSLNTKVLIPRFKRGRLTISLSKLLTLNKKEVLVKVAPFLIFHEVFSLLVEVQRSPFSLFLSFFLSFFVGKGKYHFSAE